MITLNKINNNDTHRVHWFHHKPEYMTHLAHNKINGGIHRSGWLDIIFILNQFITAVCFHYHWAGADSRDLLEETSCQDLVVRLCFREEAY